MCTIFTLSVIEYFLLPLSTLIMIFNADILQLNFYLKKVQAQELLYVSIP